MASEATSLSQFSQIITKDEFEWLEMAEFDPNTMNELLHEPTKEVESRELLVHAKGVTEASPTKILPVESYWCPDEMKEFEDVNWLDTVEEVFAPRNCVGAWYGETCMEEINEVFEIEDYANLYGDIGCIELWPENN